MSMGIAAGVIGTVAGSLIGAEGAKDAAQTSAGGANAAAQVSSDMYYQTRDDLMPYQQAGASAIPQIMQALKPIDREQALGDYFGSGEYAMVSNQANNNLLANAEATGGLGGSTNANSLMRVAPSLGMQHLGMLEGQRADQYNQLMGVANMGQNAAAQVGNAGMNYASQAGNAYQNAGNALAAGKISQANTYSNLLGSLAGFGYQAFGQPSQSSTGSSQGMGMLGFNSMGGF